MTLPDERTQSIIRTWEFLRRLRTANETPTALRSEVETLLRHYPLPYEISRAAQLRPDLFAGPDHFIGDVGKANTVGTLIELLHRFDPTIRVVLGGPNDEFSAVRQIVLISLPPDPSPEGRVDDLPSTSQESTDGQAVWIRSGPPYSVDAEG